MAAQALSVSPAALGAVLSPIQMMTYTIFVVFYVPCLATTLMTWRELGLKVALGAGGLSLVVATSAALLVRGIGLFLAIL
jgi:ferrous iron transport protein B